MGWRILFLLVLCSVGLQAQNLKEAAPSWDVEQWANLGEGQTSLDVDDFKGKLIYVFCFQSWSPGCHSEGFPVLQKITAKFTGDPTVAIVMIQTSFERFDINNFERAKIVANYYGLNIAVGQSGTEENPSSLLEKYQIKDEVPWNIIIDDQGILRDNEKISSAEKIIKRLQELKRVMKR